jgi:hypothetical protein
MGSIGFLIWVVNIGYWIVEGKLVREENLQELKIEENLHRRAQTKISGNESPSVNDTMI